MRKAVTATNAASENKTLDFRQVYRPTFKILSLLNPPPKKNSFHIYVRCMYLCRLLVYLCIFVYATNSW